MRNRSHKNRFEEGEFRKRVQFMNIGRLMTIEFEFWGRFLDAEVYGKGIKMGLLSQGEFLKVTYPIEFVEEMKQTISHMLDNY